MYIIQKVTNAGAENTGIKCETLDFAIGECKALTEGKTHDPEESDNSFRLEVYEVLENGDLNCVHNTDSYFE